MTDAEDDYDGDHHGGHGAVSAHARLQAAAAAVAVAAAAASGVGRGAEKPEGQRFSRDNELCVGLFKVR